ncbi:CU044_2847 family protein [Streptomyces sp. NBC_01334]|uniref:CU044_2847 family protein n=1 Tax=Streptomyces sp. NBC_01334 TaxID=2903827 RepID=UPI002E118290|nr:CU044_2847 family protein [Streptomyces sp. NBC_01334]
MSEFVEEARPVPVAERLVPMEVDGLTVYVAVHEVGHRSGTEHEIGGGRQRLEDALDGLMGVTRAVVGRLREAHATRTRVQFGCEFALESGSVVAVVGKARASSAFTVELEWEEQTAP